jgi:hypothetical protein
LVGTWLAERAGLGIGKPAFHDEARAFQALQRRHGVFPAQASGKGVGHSTRQKMHLTDAAVGRARGNHVNAYRQRRGLKHGHELAQGATFPLCDLIGGTSGHASDSSSS